MPLHKVYLNFLVVYLVVKHTYPKLSQFVVVVVVLVFALLQSSAPTSAAENYRVCSWRQSSRQNGNDECSLPAACCRVRREHDNTLGLTTSRTQPPNHPLLHLQYIHSHTHTPSYLHTHSCMHSTKAASASILCLCQCFMHHSPFLPGRQKSFSQSQTWMQSIT